VTTRRPKHHAASPTGVNKFGAEATLGPDPCGGQRKYSSKREARRAGELAMLKAGKVIADFFPQVSMPYGVEEDGAALRYVADFLVIEEYRADGSFVAHFEDPKGAKTERSTAKMGALRARGLFVRLI
jgi:hypothetical protein